MTRVASRRRGRRAARLLLGGALLAGAGAPASAEVLVDQNERVTDAYVLLQASMTDPATFFSRYAIAAEKEVQAWGGQALAASFDRELIEGGWPGNWNIVLNFPSAAAARGWYASPAYQAVVPYRHAATAWGNMVFLPGTPKSRLEWSIDRHVGVHPELVFPGTLDTTPQYVVSVAANWQSSVASVAVRARFAETDLRGGRLSFHLQPSAELARQATWRVTAGVRGSSGRVTRLGRRVVMPGTDVRWLPFAFRVPQSLDSDDPATQARATEPSREIEILIEAEGAPTGASSLIRIRNLNVER